MGIYSSTLDFAIQREEQAHRFYTLLARWAKTEEMRAVLTNFAQEGLQHKATLSSLKRQKAKPPEEKIRNLKISDYMTEVKPKLEMTYEDKLVFIMKKATDSLRLYRDLAAIAADDDLRNTFLTLAQDEAKHKKRFKTECKKMVGKEEPQTHGTSLGRDFPGSALAIVLSAETTSGTKRALDIVVKGPVIHCKNRHLPSD